MGAVGLMCGHTNPSIHVTDDVDVDVNMMERIAFDNGGLYDEMVEAHGEPVFEEGGVSIFADEGHGEYGAIADHYDDVTIAELSEWSHAFARAACDYSWSVSYPVIVFRDFRDADD